jgi:nucleotide-binding universal stress UspA family protein
MAIIDDTKQSRGSAPPTYGTWVVGIDGSDCAENALRWAEANAPGRATALELVTAWQTPVSGAYPMSGPVVAQFDDDDLRRAAAAEVERLAERTRTEVAMPVQPLVGHGSAATVLLDAATEGSMLVIGSRGRGGFARLLLGSTSTQCATHATVPTVVVPSDAEPVPAQRVLVGCDGSPNSMAALRWAIGFAAPHTTVTVVWVWDATPLAVGADAFFFPDASDLAAERFNHLVESVAAEADDRRVTLEREFVRGTARSALSEAAENTDMLVVGARGHGAVGSALLGSVSTWLLHHVHRPIAVVPFADTAEG